jgi:hypothetical protein
MNDDQIRQVSDQIHGKLNSLENDFTRAYIDLEQVGVASAPFPIVMYAMSILDYFSALKAGWSASNQNLNRFQTQRMIDYLVNQIAYHRQASSILVNIYRHQLMHTSEPRTIRDRNSRNVYGWGIANIDPRHMQLIEYPSPLNPQVHYFQLHFGISEFINDLKVGTDRYLLNFNNDQILQNNYTSCIAELDNKELNLE